MQAGPAWPTCSADRNLTHDDLILHTLLLTTKCFVWKMYEKRKRTRKRTFSTNTVAAREALGQDGVASFQGRRACATFTAVPTAVPDTTDHPVDNLCPAFLSL